jgi:hypothetical protein
MVNTTVSRISVLAIRHQSMWTRGGRWCKRGLLVSVLSMLPLQAIATPTTDIRFDFAGVTVGFESNSVGGLVSDSFTSLDGAVHLGAFAETGQLGTLAVASNSAALGEALAQFTDSVTAVGSGVASIAQTLSAGTLGSTAGQAAVIASLTLASSNSPEFDLEYEKRVLGGGLVLESGSLGPALLPVSNGQTFSLLATLESLATGNSTSDFLATDTIVITPLSPGLRFVAESGHDYSGAPPIPTVSQPDAWLLLATGLLAMLGTTRWLRGSE